MKLHNCMMVIVIGSFCRTNIINITTSEYNMYNVPDYNVFFCFIITLCLSPILYEYWHFTHVWKALAWPYNFTSPRGEVWAHKLLLTYSPSNHVVSISQHGQIISSQSPLAFTEQKTFRLPRETSLITHWSFADKQTIAAM